MESSQTERYDKSVESLERIGEYLYSLINLYNAESFYLKENINESNIEMWTKECQKIWDTMTETEQDLVCDLVDGVY